MEPSSDEVAKILISIDIFIYVIYLCYLIFLLNHHGQKNDFLLIIYIKEKFSITPHHRFSKQ